jgi:hypothetical protein
MIITSRKGVREWKKLIIPEDTIYKGSWNLCKILPEDSQLILGLYRLAG